MSPSPAFSYAAANRKATGKVFIPGINGFVYSGKTFTPTGTGPFKSIDVATGTNAYTYGSNAWYNLTISSLFDISTATTGTAKSAIGQPDAGIDPVAGTSAIHLASDVGTNDILVKYSMSTAFDIATESFVSPSVPITSQTTTAKGIFVRSDGARIYVVSPTAIYEYTMSAWDPSTIVYSGNSYTLDISGAVDAAFEDDGLTMYAANPTTNRIEQYDMSSPWGLSTMSNSGLAKDISGLSTDVGGISIANNNRALYIIDATSSAIYQFDK